jgi:hypothetical protein
VVNNANFLLAFCDKNYLKTAAQIKGVDKVYTIIRDNQLIHALKSNDALTIARAIAESRLELRDNVYTFKDNNFLVNMNGWSDFILFKSSQL